MSNGLLVKGQRERKIKLTGKQPVPVPFHLPQIPQGLVQDWNGPLWWEAITQISP